MAVQSGGSYLDVDDVPEIIPLNEYNFKKAKLKVSLQWLAFKAHHSLDSDVPEDLLIPFFQDDTGHDNLKPSVIYQLTSGELYSLACSNIFQPSIHPWRGHGSVIQALSRKGIYILDSGEPVAEVNLTQTQRIKLSSHQAMIDAIMQAYTVEAVSVEAVVKAVRQIATFDATNELPFDREDALLFWINKVCLSVKRKLEQKRKLQQEQLIQAAQQTVRMRRDQLHIKELPFIPLAEDLMKDLSDGCCLSLLIHHYCPHLLKFDDIVLRENMSFADSLHNLQLLRSFFQEHLPETFHFQLEDLLYTHHSIKPSLMAFMAELFSTFELTKPDNLTNGQYHGVPVSGPVLNNELSQINLPISQVTKRSFQHHHQSTPDPHLHPSSFEVRSSSSPGSQQRLLPGRKQKRSSMVIEGNPPAYQDKDLRRSTSLEDLSPEKPLPAWQSPDIIRSSDEPSARKKNPSESLLANVSIDSDVGSSQTFSAEPDVGHSQETYLVSTKPNWEGALAASHLADDDDTEVAALTSRLSPRIVDQSRGGFHPLDLPPAGITSHSADMKKRMRLDLSLAEKSSRSAGSSPRDRLMPSPGRTPKEQSGNVTKTLERGESKSQGSNSRKDAPSGMISWEQKLYKDKQLPSSTPESLDSSTPQSGETVIDAYATDQKQKARKKWANQAFQQKTSDGSNNITKTKHGEAFFVSHDPDKANETGKSFVLTDKQYDEETAHQAGIPVVMTSQKDLEMMSQQDTGHHKDLNHPSNMQFISYPAFSVSRSAHATPNLKATVSSSLGHFSVASDSALPLHASSHSPQQFYLSDYNIPQSLTDETYDEGRLNGSVDGNPLSNGAACQSNESIKLHAELLESESKLPDPTENFVDGPSSSHSSGEPLTVNDLASVTPENMNMHEQITDNENDHMITWLVNNKATSNTINLDPEVQVEPPVSELAQIRMQLEKKRRHIDHEKRKLERQWYKQRVKVSKEAFLQCVTQRKTPDDPYMAPSGRNIVNSERTPARDIHPVTTKITFADISAQREKQQFRLKDDLKAFSDSSQSGRSATDSGSNRSGSPTSSAGSHSPQLTHDEYNASIEKLNANLTELQSQITRLSLQQEQMKTTKSTSAEADLTHPESSENKQTVYQTLNTFVTDSKANDQPPMAPKLSPRPIGPIVQNQEEFRNSRSSWVEQSTRSDVPDVVNSETNSENNNFAKTFTLAENESGQVTDTEVADKKQMYMEINLSPDKKVPPKPKLKAKTHAVLESKGAVSAGEVTTSKQQPPVNNDLHEREPLNGRDQTTEIDGAAKVEEKSENLSSSVSDDKPVGFTVEMAKQHEDDEMAKRREVFLKAQLKRQEQERKKKAAREEEIEKQREERRKKQEEQEQKKAEEKARREQIMQEYHKKKKREQEGEQDRPPPKPKSKSRPKSRVVADSSAAKHPVLSGGEPAPSGRRDAGDSGSSTQQMSSHSTVSQHGVDEITADTAATATAEGDTTPSSSSSAFSKIKADKSFQALPDRQGPRMTPKSTLSPDSPSKGPNGSNMPQPIKRSGSFKGTSGRPPSPGRSSPGRRSPSPRPPSPQMQRRRSNTLPESLQSDESDGIAKNSGSIPSDTLAREQSVVSQESNSSGGVPEYTGPKLYVKPTSRSNKHIICNAISHCVLAGVPNSPQRDKVLEEVNKSDHKHFMILFRDQGLQFRAVYGYNPETDEVAKVYGTGPRHVNNKMLECIYKYDSGSKKFSKIHSKTLSVQVDGLIIGQVYWQSKKPSTKR